MMTRRQFLSLGLAAAALGSAACGRAGAAVSGATASAGASAAASASATAAATRLVVATGFQPDVLFAPYYVAQALGYYRAVGLDVTMNYDRIPDLLPEVGSGRYAFAVTGGDNTVLAAASGAPVTYVMAQYQKYPVGAMTLRDGGPTLTDPKQLKGLRIGISAPNNSTDFGLEALLRAGGLTRKDVTVVTIGFTETQALVNRRVDVAMTFIDNEPVQAAALGYPVNVLPVANYVKLVGTGVVTSRAMVQDHPDVVRAFVKASLQGLAYTLQHPDDAFAICLRNIPNLVDAKQIDVARQVLAQRLTFQQPPTGHPLGWSDPAAWTTTVSFLQGIGLVHGDLPPAAVFSNAFAEAADVRV
jgi:NitT/TauT family transport system substrate-binding protein